MSEIDDKDVESEDEDVEVIVANTLKEEDILVAYDYICEKYYGGEKPEVNLKDLCILHHFPKTKLKTFSVIFPYVFAWIKYNDKKRRVSKKNYKMLFDRVLMERIFEFLHIDTKYIVNKFTLVQLGKSQSSSSQRYGKAVLDYYGKFACRSKDKYEIISNLITDIAAYYGVTKLQLLNLIK